MARPRRLSVLAATLALAFPAAALAGGSAGDNQYSDPFGNTQPSQAPPAVTNTTPAATPPATSTSAPAAAPSSSSRASTTAEASGQLPRTGLDLRLVGGIGIVLVAGGIALRRRLA
jgi:predicted flap endonuclease-1-like 5' DNA nuclease